MPQKNVRGITFCKYFAFRAGATKEEYTVKGRRPKYPTEVATPYKCKRHYKKTSRTGFEPVISALRGRRPGPLDERDIFIKIFKL